MTLKFNTCMHGYKSCESCNETHTQEIATLHSLCDKMAAGLSLLINQCAYFGCLQECDNGTTRYGNQCQSCDELRIAKETLKEYHSGKGEK